MAFGEIVLAVGDAIALIKEIIELIKLIEENEDTINNALNQLKEFCEGSLVETLEDVVNKFVQFCKELVDNFNWLMEGMIKNIEEIEKSDTEGAQLLREALM